MAAVLVRGRDGGKKRGVGHAGKEEEFAEGVARWWRKMAEGAGADGSTIRSSGGGVHSDAAVAWKTNLKIDAHGGYGGRSRDRFGEEGKREPPWLWDKERRKKKGAAAVGQRRKGGSPVVCWFVMMRSQWEEVQWCRGRNREGSCDGGGRRRREPPRMGLEMVVTLAEKKKEAA